MIDEKYHSMIDEPGRFDDASLESPSKLTRLRLKIELSRVC